MLKHFAPLALLLAAPAFAETLPSNTQQQAVEAELAKAPKGTRFGLLVIDDTGKVIVAVNPDQRFIPASNTKMFTTAAAMALLPETGTSRPDGSTEVYLVPAKQGKGSDVLLVGHGNPALSSAPDCKVACLATLADAIAAKTRVVGDVIGDDAIFSDQRWSLGMSWNNLGGDDATAASALSLDDNALPIEVRWDKQTSRASVQVSSYVTVTVPSVIAVMNPFRRPDFQLEHQLNSRSFRLYVNTANRTSQAGLPDNTGELWRTALGIDDPAHYAAWTLAALLRQRGVTVKGKLRALHRPVEVDMGDEGALRTSGGAPLATVAAPPLIDDVAIINKQSQNLHAELLLRRMAIGGSWNTLEDGLAAERALFELAGIPREGYDFSDGSGMSTYNRVSPRAGVALLRWIDTQSWGKAWYASLPIAGVDGTLKRRFTGTPLANNLIAKTGTLNATNALSGTFRAASGKRLTFSFFANDVPNGQTAIPAMEAVLLALYAAN